MPVRFLGFACLLIALAIAFLQPSFASEPRVALVIGNADYGQEIGRLKNPANDARLMAETLKGLGFRVELVLDADQKAMKRAVKGFGAKLREAGKDATGLFYYAGHGVQVEGTNYLLPVGAEIEAEADVEIESIAADDVMTQMQSAGNAVNLVFLDACRNNPLVKASRSATRGLARLDAPRGSFVGYSTAPGDVAADGDGANSPYALALAEELKRPGISVEEAHRNVRAKVLAESGNKQTPWDSSSLTGAVILAEKAPEPAATPAPPPAAAPQPEVHQQALVDKESLFWESIKDSTDAADFEAYLAQFPEGVFAPLAKNRIAVLSQPAQATPAGPTQTAPAPAAATIPPAAEGARLVVPVSVKAEIDSYLANLTSEHWALAIARNGSRTAKFRCGQMSGGICWGGGPQEKANREAIKRCGGPSECFLLYERATKKAIVEIVAQSESGAAAQGGGVASASAEASAAPVAGEIAVTPEVRERIASYLGNISDAKVWALAVARDGASVEVLGCPKLNPGTMGARCAGFGTSTISQSLVSARALKNCGGPDACILLYEGATKVSGLVPDPQ